MMKIKPSVVVFSVFLCFGVYAQSILPILVSLPWVYLHVKIEELAEARWCD